MRNTTTTPRSRSATSLARVAALTLTGVISRRSAAAPTSAALMVRTRRNRDTRTGWRGASAGSMGTGAHGRRRELLRSAGRRPGRAHRLPAILVVVVRDVGVVGGHGDRNPVLGRRRVDRVLELLVRPAGADHEDPARPVARADEGVPRAGGAVHEVPRVQVMLLAVEDERAAPAEHEEVLLLVLRVVARVRLARLEDPDVDPQLWERLLGVLEEHDRPLLRVRVGRGIRHVDDVRLAHARSISARGGGEQIVA